MPQLLLGLDDPPPPRQALAPGAVLLRGLALGDGAELLRDVEQVVAGAGFRHLTTPGGHRMSVAMTNCGPFGWVSDAAGYRYSPLDPNSGRPWPAMPISFRRVADAAAAEAGFPGFTPDCCLVNRYAPGARLTLHQDRNEHDLLQPIVSVSLGLPATFLFGGLQRSDRPERIVVRHGDVVVFGGPARLRFHGVMPLAEGHHEATGHLRINLTFRRVAA